MATLYLLFNHQLTEAQKENAHKVLGVVDIVDLKPWTGDLWSAIPTGEVFPQKEVDQIIQTLTEKTHPGDFLLVLGEWGAVYYIVDWCFHTGRIPCHTTTSRKVLEEVATGKNEIDVTRKIFPDSFRLYRQFSS